MALTVTWVDVGALAVGVYCLKQLLSKKPPPLPPGPKGLPIVGNLADMPSSEEWKTFAKWGETYGDLMSVTLLGQPIIIVNSFKHAFNLLDKRSAIYSDRPPFPIGELTGWTETMTLTPYGDKFRKMRKLMHGVLGNEESLQPWFGMEELEVHRFLRRVLEDPDHPEDAFRT